MPRSDLPTRDDVLYCSSDITMFDGEPTLAHPEGETFPLAALLSCVMLPKDQN